MKYPKLPEVRTDEALHGFAERYLILKVAQMREPWKNTFDDFLRGGNIDAGTRDAKVMRAAWDSALDMATDSLNAVSGAKSFLLESEVSFAASTDHSGGFGGVQHTCVATHKDTGQQAIAKNVFSSYRARMQAQRTLESLVLNLPAQPLTQKEVQPQQEVQPQKDDLLAKVEQLGMRVVELTETLTRTKEGKDDAVAFLEEMNKQRNDLLELVKVQTTLLQGLQLTQASILDSQEQVVKTEAKPAAYDEEAERKQFESEFAKWGGKDALKRLKAHPDLYLLKEVTMAWLWWKARAERADSAVLTVLPYNEDAERAQFEKAMRHECDMERKVAGPHDGTYTYRPTHLAWEAWKARAKATSAANL